MVALKNGIIQNKDGHPFDRSTGTWKNQNVAENPNVVQENVSNSDEKNTSTKNSDTTTQNSNSTETQQTDAENKNPSATNEKSTAETPKPPAETPKPTAETPKPTAETPKPIDDLFADLLNDLPPAETPKPTAETPKPPAETPKPPAETPKPHIISYNIDGKQVLIPFDDLPHFNELRRQLASGIPLDDDLIRKIKPILTETHLRDGTKIFNDNSKLSQLDNAMKHYRGKQISSLDDFLRFVLHTIR